MAQQCLLGLPGPPSSGPWTLTPPKREPSFHPRRLSWTELWAGRQEPRVPSCSTVDPLGDCGIVPVHLQASVSLSVKRWSLGVPLALLLCPESLPWSWEEVELCGAFCPPWGPSMMISSGELTDPGGWAEGTADGCPGLSGVLACRPCGHCWPTLQVRPSGLG